MNHYARAAETAARDVPSRRDFLAAVGGGVLTLAGLPSRLGAWAAPLLRPRPTRAQLAWQRDEFALFVHFGINSFTDREWGDGTESPSLFNPTRLDPRQWARVAREAGAKALVLTAKHHDGFCLWPTATTRHSVASSPWMNGHGDVVRLFVEACRAEGLKPGLYCSPWDRNHPAYGDTPRYNAIFHAQLTELLTRYGAIHEVWFDGANGEGPNGKRQVYDWPGTWTLVRRLQPNAVIFSDVGPDIRWVGNERGASGETHWSTIDPDAVRFPGDPSPDVPAILQEGHADGTVWRPSETDVSIRPGWFHHPAEDVRVKSVDDLVRLWFSSVGRNSKLLLNVPPTRDGVFHDTDVAHLIGLRQRLDALDATAVAGVRITQEPTGATTATLTVQLREATLLRVVSLSEPIAEGQVITRWTLRSGTGTPVLATGTTIGHRRLVEIPPTYSDTLTLEVTALDRVPPLQLTAYTGVP